MKMRGVLGMGALRRLGCLMVVVVAWSLAPVVVAQASTGSFTPGPGTYNVDTTALTLTGPGTNVTGVDQGGIAVFSFDTVSIPAGATLDVTGSRPLELQATGTFTLAGLIDGSGMSAIEGTEGPYAGGPGGGAGANDFTQAASGPGAGGGGSTNDDGGGGGGFGGQGAAGGSDGGTGGAGGISYGNLNLGLQGGSGGGGGSDAGGGGGGGAIELQASSLTVATTGQMRVNGGDGSGAGDGASAGGSGGGIILNASTIDVAGTLSANGGAGGTGGCCGDGGGGGGGRIAYQYGTLVSAGTASVTGGTSGTSGTYSHGELSPEVVGATGVVTDAQAPSATTSAASSVRSTDATLNGIVNPNGNATTYQFQYGTSTAYGKSIPVPGSAVGSDSTNHALSQLVSGLAPRTTYHYRIVATDRLLLTTVGSDKTFTTPAPPVVVTGGASKVGSKSATVKGSVNPHGGVTTYDFQYGPSKHYGKSTKVKSAGNGTKKLSVSAHLARLRPGAIYHYRLVAQSGITVNGRGRTFKTKALIAIKGLSSRGCTTASNATVRIRVTSVARIKHANVTLDGKRIASSRHSSLRLQVALSGLTPGFHKLTVTTHSAAGTTKRTLRFRVC